MTEAAHAAGPLDGLHVLDLTTLLPGPFASQILADLGATVIKVEPPAGDRMRTLSPATFPVMNRGKRSVALDLKTESGSATLRRLIADADVLMESFRPGVMARLGFDTDTVAGLRPGIVYLSMSGWGQHGPAAHLPAHNGNFMARTGATFLAASKGQAPTDPTAIPEADMSAALYAVIAVLAALRVPSNDVIHLDVSLFSSALALMMPRLAEYASHGGQPTGDELMRRRPGHGVFVTQDGGLVLLAAVEDHFWVRLCEAIDRHDLTERADLATHDDRRKHVDELNAVLREAMAQHPRGVWLKKLQELDVPASAVLEPSEVVDDEQVDHLGVLRDWPTVTSFLPITGLPTAQASDAVPGLDSHGDAVRRSGWTS